MGPAGDVMYPTPPSAASTPPQVSQMEQEYSLKEQGLSAQVRELEECMRSSSAEMTSLVTAQQKRTQRWKEEAKNLIQSFETKITGIK